ncbi:MAG: 50S ribosomal protein L13 [bacterium]|nr:50S ribosomal protein L13 [bacterium]
MRITKRTNESKEQWYIIDAENKILGRLACRIANILMGKEKTSYTHDALCGDFVIVVNADKIKLTGDKLNKKLYTTHSNYPGGFKQKTAGSLLKTNPKYLINSAVKGMLPKNKLQDKLMTRLKVYRSTDHPHKAQNPVLLNA